MGEQRSRTVGRAAASTGLAVAAALLLASCSLPGAIVTDAPSAPPATVIDPSVPTDSPTPTPIPSETVVATPEVTPSAASPTATAASDTSTNVTPFVTSATWDGGAISVSAIVPKIVERGGTCTATATKGGTTRSAKSAAVAAASYTGCEPITIDGVGSGTWSVVVRYYSPTSAGTSAARTVTAG